MFLDGEGEGEEHLDVLLDALDGLLVVAELGIGFVVAVVGIAVIFEAVVFEDVEDPGGVEAEVDADVAVLFEAGVVEVGAEAQDADGAGFVAPEGVELGFFGGGGGDVGGPEVPLHLELYGHVVVEVLGGLGDGVFDDGVGGVFGAVVVDVEALVGGGLGEVDGVDGGGGDAAGLGLCGGVGRGGYEGELAEHAGEGRGEGFEAKVGVPEAEIELVGHLIKGY